MKRADLFTGILCLAVFTAVCNLVVLIPILTDVAHAFDVSEARVGQLATLHALVAATVALLVAPLIDRYPRGSVLRVECLILIAGTIVSATAQSFFWLAAGRVLAGIGAAIIIATCLAIVTDLYPDETLRNRRLGLVASSAALSTVLGLPILTQVAARANWQWSIASLSLPLLAVVAATWLLPGTRPVVDTTGERRSLRGEYTLRYGAVLSDRGTACLLGIQFVIAAVIGGLWLYFAAWAEIDFLVSSGALSVLFLLSGLCELVTSNITPRLLELVAPSKAFIAEALVLAGCLLGVGAIFTEQWMLFPFVLLVSLTGLGLFFINTILLINAQQESPGTTLALQSVCSELGWAGGAIIGGVTLAALDSYTALYRVLGLFLLLAVGLLLLRPSPAEAPLPAGEYAGADM